MNLNYLHLKTPKLTLYLQKILSSLAKKSGYEEEGVDKIKKHINKYEKEFERNFKLGLLNSLQIVDANLLSQYFKLLEEDGDFYIEIIKPNFYYFYYEDGYFTENNFYFEKIDNHYQLIVQWSSCQHYPSHHPYVDNNLEFSSKFIDKIDEIKEELKLTQWKKSKSINPLILSDDHELLEYLFFLKFPRKEIALKLIKFRKAFKQNNRKIEKKIN